MPDDKTQNAVDINSETLPVVVADQDGMITHINDAFVKTYKWEREKLVGNPLSLIVPEHMREMHHMGFSRLLATETPRILGKPLKLPVLMGDGSQTEATHNITGEKKSDGWVFKATIKKIE